MYHGVIHAGQMSWDAAEQAHWHQDVMDKLHNDDALWAFALRASDELRMLDRQCLNDNACVVFLGWESSTGLDWTQHSPQPGSAGSSLEQHHHN